jgi:hypothetical protein
MKAIQLEGNCHAHTIHYRRHTIATVLRLFNFAGVVHPDD